METLFASYLIFSCCLWCLIYIYAMLTWNRIPRFEKLSVNLLTQWPRLSIVVPACNEADTISHAVEKLLRQNYPALEIILVNDRSTDDTGHIIEELASRDKRIKVVHITELPADWLGKVHAMHIGTQQTTGDWLLFSDADIHYDTDLLPRVVSYAEQHKLDHLALVPNVISDNWLLQAITKAFGILFMVGARANAVKDPDKSAAIGIGAFNLVRRSAFALTPGFEWLRMEPVDDVSLAFMLKRQGFRTRFALAYQDLSVRWYPTISAMAEGFEKNAVGPMTHYRYGRLFILSSITTAIVVAPYLSLVWWHSPAFWFAIGWLACHVLLAARVALTEKENPLPWLLVPIGILAFHFIYLRAAYLLVKQQGIIWRGTHYPIEKLRQYQRLKL